MAYIVSGSAKQGFVITKGINAVYLNSERSPLVVTCQLRLLLNKARRTKNKPFWSFSISFEEAKQYRRKFLNVLTRESQWDEIIVDVYL